jgi:hypothetical protein
MKGKQRKLEETAFENDAPVPVEDFKLSDGQTLDGSDGPDREEIFARFGRKNGALTLPQVLAHVRERVDDYVNLFANNKDLKKNDRRTRDMVVADIELKDMVGFECSQRQSQPDVSNLIAEWICNRPGLLNNPANREWFGLVMADWLEAAHFGMNQRRVRGLLPKERKAAAKVARGALKILSKGERGSPPRYPAHLLAGIVLEIQEVFRPIRETWQQSGCRLEAVEIAFSDEVAEFTDKELRSLVTDSLATAAARLAEKVTGISKESFETAWAKESEARKSFQTK